MPHPMTMIRGPSLVLQNMERIPALFRLNMGPKGVGVGMFFRTSL